MIEVKEITLDSEYSTSGEVYRTENIKVIKTKDIEDFKEWMINLPTPVKDIDVGKKVMFDKDVIFSRRKFHKYFPENKIVNNIKEADVVIIDKDGIKNRYCNKWYWSRQFSIKANGNYHDSHISGESFITSTHGTTIEDLVNRLNSLYEMKEKDIMDVKDLHLPSEETLTPESYDKIGNMLNSTDDKMRVMGMNLLTAYNYEKDKFRIALLVSLYWTKWMQVRGNKENVEIKTMLRKISIDFAGFNISSTNPKFWLKVGSEAGEDEIVQKAFNLWVKTIYPEAPELKLVKISE